MFVIIIVINNLLFIEDLETKPQTVVDHLQTFLSKTHTFLDRQPNYVRNNNDDNKNRFDLSSKSF